MLLTESYTHSGQLPIAHLKLKKLPSSLKYADYLGVYCGTLGSDKISIEEKLRQLEEEKICKVCMDRRITIICIPCGHLVACAVCADVLDKCPICCTIIKRRQKIVMS
ncbi:hypothetical protein XELAEV_18042025mg [Xenopus laevis]|uniref:RING-type E3 ubiquitin transferase n=1 Tax=Xenopus laevis TaxID=8355 RepID=A0A974H5N8_XENLA|nr:hypothetical protein XELAEV_18042025mg [Xenopus laevis]